MMYFDDLSLFCIPILQKHIESILQKLKYFYECNFLMDIVDVETLQIIANVAAIGIAGGTIMIWTIQQRRHQTVSN